MKDDRESQRTQLLRIKQSLVEDILGQSDEQILAEAREDGIHPDEVRSRVLDAFRKAKHTAEAAPTGNAGTPPAPDTQKRPSVLNIDAARARTILKRVASRTRSNTPLPLAASFDQAKGEEAIRIVSELRDLGLLSDDELK